MRFYVHVWVWMACIVSIVMPLPVAASDTSQDDTVSFFQSEFFPKVLEIHADVFPPEVAIETLLPLMRKHPGYFRDKTVLDIGTGCGILALYAASLGAKKVVATDISEAAIINARNNAKRLGYEHIIEWRLVSADNPGAFSVIKPGETFDTIISNPPIFIDTTYVGPGDAYTESGQFIVSILKGLPTHLSKQGIAIIRYETLFSQSFVEMLAPRYDLSVISHPSDRIIQYEIQIIYDTYAKELQKKLGIKDTVPFVPFKNMYADHIALPKPKTVPVLFEDVEDPTYYPGVMVLRSNRVEQ